MTLRTGTLKNLLTIKARNMDEFDGAAAQDVATGKTPLPSNKFDGECLDLVKSTVAANKLQKRWRDEQILAKNCIGWKMQVRPAPMSSYHVTLTQPMPRR